MEINDSMRGHLAEEGPALSDGTGLITRFRRRKSYFAACFLITLTLVAGIYTVLPATYRAWAALVVSGNEPLLGGTSAAEAQRQGDPADVESQMLMLRSPRLIGQIIQQSEVIAALLEDCRATRDGSIMAILRLQPAEKDACQREVADRQWAMQRIAAGLSVTPTGRSRVIEVSFTSPAASSAAAIANALTDTYLTEDRAQRVTTREAAIAWLNTEIARLGEELRRSELAVEAYRREHGLVRGQHGSISSERLSSLTQLLAEAQAAYARAASRIDRLDNQRGDVQELLDNRAITDLKQQQALVASQYADFSQRLGSRHPSLLAVAQQRVELQRRLDEEVKRYRMSIEREHAAAAARVDQLNRQQEQLKTEVGMAGDAEAGITTLVRDLEARREIFVDLSKKANELETERRLIAGNAKLVNSAELPDRPWFPKRAPFAAAGLVLATLVGAGLSLLRDSADRTVRATMHLPRMLGLPILGYIPRVRQRRSVASPVLEVKQTSLFQESVRALFGRCLLINGAAPQVLMITSSEPREGKSFLVLSMALFAASTGRRILAIEGDLRQPTFGQILPAGSLAGPGLSEYLRGEVSLYDIVRRNMVPGLDVITAGQPVIDSMELLSNGRIDTLLQGARENYDLILIDSPPALSLIDASILARRADGVLFCVSWGQSRLDTTFSGVKAMQAAGGRVLGLVLGMVRDADNHLYTFGGKYPLALPKRA